MFMKYVAALTLLATIYGVWPACSQPIAPAPAPVVIIINQSPGAIVDMSKNSNE